MLPVAGCAADRVGYRRVLFGAGLVYAAGVVPAFHVIDTGAVGSVAAAILALAVSTRSAMVRSRRR